MDDKGEIVSSCDVDENIALQIWTKGGPPRLVIQNKGQNTRKFIRLNWLEKLDRKLSVKGKKRGESTEYSLADLLPHLQRILEEYSVYSSFKPRLWKLALKFERALHTPEIVSDKGELSILSEGKRACMWVADVTGDIKSEGEFRPFFPILEEEQDAFSGNGLPIVENRRGVEDLVKTGTIHKLVKLNPMRWHRPVQLMSAATLLSFSFCEEDGSELSDKLWDDEADLKLKLGDPRLVGIGRKCTGYIRHFASLGKIEARSSNDSDKELLGKNYSRKRRVTIASGQLGDVEYSVTFFDHEDGSFAIGCKPRGATSRHTGDLIYSMPLSVYEQALSNDSFGGAADDFFTISQIVGAKNFEIWMNNVATYIAPFSSLL